MMQQLLTLVLYIAPTLSSPIQQPLSHHLLPDIPNIGLGLWNSLNTSATNAVTSAFNSSYTMLDSAAAYSNEQFVGRALKPPRHTYWLTSKLWNTAHRPSLVPSAFNKTLSDLSTPYLDLYLMHWPVAFKPSSQKTLDPDTSITSTWAAMELLVDAYHATNGSYGTRFIGISNFSPRQIDEILAMCRHCPYAHEFETHPYLQQGEFVRWHAKQGIKVIAYSPLGNMNPIYGGEMGKLLDDEVWKGWARKKNCTVAQAVLGWGMSRGTSVIPKSVHGERIEENIGARRVRFSEREIEKIEEDDRRVRFNDPGKGWGVKLFEGLDGGSDRFVEGEL